MSFDREKDDEGGVSKSASTIELVLTADGMDQEHISTEMTNIKLNTAND